MTIISLVMPYYRNPGQLSLQYAEMTRWSEKAKAQIEVVIVDDGSPEPAVDVERPEGLPDLRIYRVLEDRPWWQHGCRNIGAHEAVGPWLLLTDIDHVLTAEAADALLKRLGRLDAGTAYFLHRIEADTGLPTLNAKGKMKPHPNSFVMTRGLYWRVGGYDEDYCGQYGTDGLFKTRLFATAKEGFLKKVPLVRYWRDIVPDANTATLPRKEGRKPGEREAVAIRKAAEGRADQIVTLSQEYERAL
ncbi:glycosyltransferase family 2 protein [Sphingopyxis flava]|uniref:Glycosyl transferase family 2 n=1 Tax=Sphingopyxis flava TaxID=1507287 RepID=A0A1T4ZX48_9SPHN|nr:glycosyltransferase [Sphingopyxis flava]SKB27175.1 Glycosyl transferase family 2 [Sphingopyxis flava]